MDVKAQLKKMNQALYPQHLFYGPEWLVLGVNNVCNLHCKMCDVGVGYTESNFYQNLVGTHPIHMPLELFKTIADQAALYFPKTKLGYAFTEPLVYSNLYESLKYAQAKGLFTSITTNGLALRKWADKLCDAGLDEIYVSLDGPAAIHNETRGLHNSFEKAVEGISYLLAQKNSPRVSVFCVVTQWNIGHLQAFLEYFRDFPLKEIGFMHTNYTPDSVADAHNLLYGADYPATASNMQDIDLHAYDLNLLWEETEAIRKNTYPFKVSFSPELNNRESLSRFYLEPEKFYGHKCVDVSRTIMIKSNGDVIPAHGRCYNLKIGNLYTQNLKQIWNSPQIAGFRKTLQQAGGLLPACSRCCSAFGH